MTDAARRAIARMQRGMTPNTIEWSTYGYGTVTIDTPPQISLLSRVNEYPIDGRARGTVLCHRVDAVPIGHVDGFIRHGARLHFQFDHVGWNERAGSLVDAKGEPLYPYADFNEVLAGVDEPIIVE